MKRYVIIAAVIFNSLQCFAQGAGHFNFYADIRNNFNYYTRESVYDRYGMFNLLPADLQKNEVNLDFSDHPYMEWLNFDTKLGVEWTGFRVRRFDMSAKFEAEVYARSGNNTLLRLRNAFFNLGYVIDNERRIDILVGQEKHPFAVNSPDVLSSTYGTPFNAYSYAPQLKVGIDAFEWMKVSLAALWQGEFCSYGPGGWSSKYMQWSCCPELYFGIDFRHRNFHVGAGVAYLCIKPRLTGLYPGTDTGIWVGDKVQNLSGFLSLGYDNGLFSFRGKTILAQGGEHMNLMGGYAICGIKNNGTYQYTPYLTSSSWFSLSYGHKLKGSLFGGFIENLGTSKPLYLESNTLCFYNQDCYNLLRTARIAPGIRYTFWDMLTIGLEYEFSAAQYGDKERIIAEKSLCLHGLHFVFGNRIGFSARCTLDARNLMRRFKGHAAPYEASREF